MIDRISRPLSQGSLVSARPWSRRLLSLWRAMRPRQWVKNSVLLAGIVFTLNQAHPTSDWVRAAAAVGLFCMLSSAVYLFNDICDVQRDRAHPRKRQRPLAAGEITVSEARTLATGLTVTGIAGSALLGGSFLLLAILYVTLTAAYSARLKHVVLVDVIALALCYVVRAAAGAAVVSVEISPWLFGCTFLSALLLGLAKRRNEIAVLTDAGSHRRCLEDYTLPMVDQMITVVAACTITAYMLYTFFSRTASQRPALMASVPFVIYGIFRFLYLVHRHGKGGDPAAEVIEDPPLLLCGLLWLATCALIIALRH